MSVLSLLCLLALLACTTPAAPPARAQTPVRPASVGFSPGAGLVWATPGDQARELDAIASTGARWVRLDLDWSGVEGRRGRYDWTALDRVIDAVHARGMQVLALPAYTPAWARPAGTDTHAPPDDPAHFAAFAAAAAARYAPRGVLAWEVWNEPNLGAFWSPRPDVAGYAALLRLTARALHAVDPRLTVLSGGLAPADDGPTTQDPRRFLEDLYATGVMADVDGVAVHPYSFPALASDASTAAWNTFQRMTAMRATMVAAGDAAKQVWLTETGAPTGSARGAVSEQRQAEIVVDAVTAAAALPWTGPVMLYAARDAGTDPTDREDNFGLLRRDFSPKPAWHALTALLAASAPVPVTPPAPAATPVAAPAPALAAPTVVRARWTRTPSLRWTRPPGAAGFRVERAPATGGARRWTLLARPTASTFTDRTARPGARYAYRVVATAGTRLGPPSTEVRGTVPRS